MNVDSKFAKEIEAELLKEPSSMPVSQSAVPGTARGEINSAKALLQAIGNDIVTLGKALDSMASAVEKMQQGLSEAHEMISRGASRL